MPDSLHKSILLGNDMAMGKPLYLHDSDRRYGTYILGRSETTKEATLLRLALHDIEAGRGLFFLDPGAELTRALLQRIGRPFQDRLLLFDPTHDTHTFCINPVWCPDPMDDAQRAEAYARTYPVLHQLLSAVLSRTHPSLRGMAKESYLRNLIINSIPVFLENQEYTLSELPLFLENRQFREYLLRNVRFNHKKEESLSTDSILIEKGGLHRDYFVNYRCHGQEPVRFWKEFSETDSLNFAFQLHHLFTNHILSHILGGPETTIDLLSLLSEGKITIVSFSKSVEPECKSCISCLLLGGLIAAIKGCKQYEDKQFSIYVSEPDGLPYPEDFKVLFPDAPSHSIMTTFSASELREEFVDVAPIRHSITSATNIFFNLPEKDAWTLAPELIQNLPPPRTGFKREEVITPTPIEHIWEHGSPLENVTKYRERYFWPVELLKNLPQLRYYPFKPEVYTIVPTVGHFNPDFTTFVPWACYRSSAEMLREGISLLNDYYYQAMTDRVDFLRPPSGEQLDRFVRVLNCFAGFFGYYPTFRPSIPDTPSDSYPFWATLLRIMLNTHKRRPRHPLGNSMHGR